MIARFFRLIVLVILPSVSCVAVVQAASFDCDKATTETEKAICADPELSALGELAGILSKYVGLVVSVDRVDPSNEEISDHYYVIINTLLGLVAKPDLPSLLSDLGNSSTWKAEINPRNVIIIRPQIYGPQEVLIIFDDKYYPTFVEMEYNNSAFAYEYSIENSILSVSMNASPANLLYKYRWQNECWRLIGEESTFNHRGHNPNNDPVGRSINYLTGQATLSYDIGDPIARTFDPEVWCISEGKVSNSIKYHDGKNLD